MKINSLRSSFVIHCLGFFKEQRKLSQSLQGEGFKTQWYEDYEAWQEICEKNPPHIVVLDYDHVQAPISLILTECARSLPETHVIFLTSEASFEEAIQFYSQGVYDVVRYGSSLSLKPLHCAIDRAIQSDMNLYEAEQLVRGMDLRDRHEWEELRDWLNKLYHTSTVDEAASAFVDFSNSSLGAARHLFLRYVPTRRSLLVSKVFGEGLSRQHVGMGVHLDDQYEPNSESVSEELEPFLEILLQRIVGNDPYRWNPVFVAGKLHSAIIRVDHKPNQISDPRMEVVGAALERQIQLLEMTKRFHTVNQRDESTGLFTRKLLLEKISSEISRSRRILKPVSLIVMKWPQLDQARAENSQAVLEIVQKSIAQVLQKTSRNSDLCFVLSEGEFAVLLPHTSLEGARIKALRVKRSIESIKLSKVVQASPNIKICVGVSEYPALGRDAEELFESADQALFSAINEQGPSIKLATPIEGHQPDFEVQA